uniref:Methyltransf_25 domain-containing protein n=1 Tax=Globodera pallida TaxID=36090 RepID=A0A183BWQ3_GLOPA
MTTFEQKSDVKEEKEEMQQSSSSIFTEFKRNKLELEARKNWDRFYKRNSNNFFKDRNWTRREIEQLCGQDVDLTAPLTVLDAGCGCGNTLFPLAKCFSNWQFCGIDFSPNALSLLQQRATELGTSVRTELMDLLDESPSNCALPGADLATLIFVLSSISLEHQAKFVRNLRKFLKPSGSVVFRDYGVSDHAMLRFSDKSKISERFFVRQDGTRAYFFYPEERI